MKYLHPILAAISCVVIGYTVDLSSWLEMKDGLLAFLGLISAALLQLIPVTTNFLTSEELTPAEAEELTRSLGRQQNFWVGMFAVNGLTVATIVVAAIVKTRLIWEIPGFGVLDMSPVFSGVIGGLLVFLGLRLVPVLGGVLSLQNLRSRLVIDAAKRRAADKAEKIQRDMAPPADLTPPDYGKIIRPH